jgi:hypothetical protein
MSPFGYGHDPDGAAAPGKAVVVGAGALLPLHAVTSAVAATSRTAPAPVRLVARVLIRVLIRDICQSLPGIMDRSYILLSEIYSVRKLISR